MKIRLAAWETWIAAAAGLAAAFLMPADFYGSAVSEIVTVIGFLIAAFVPAMVLAATALRAGGFSVRKIHSLGRAIRRQIDLFGGLFLYSLAACLVLIIGKISDWSFSFVTIPYLPKATSYLASVYPAALTFLLVFLTLRSFAFIAGIGSLLSLTVTIAEDEAIARDERAGAHADDDLDNYKLPDQYGTELR